MEFTNSQRLKKLVPKPCINNCLVLAYSDNSLQIIQLVIRFIITDGPKETHKKELVGGRQ